MESVVLVVKALTWHTKDLDLSPTWIQCFSVNRTGIERNIYILSLLMPVRSIALPTLSMVCETKG